VESLQDLVTNKAVKITIEINWALRLCEPSHNFVYEASPFAVNDGKAIQCFAGSQNQAGSQRYAVGVSEDQKAEVSVQTTTNRPVGLGWVHPGVSAARIRVQFAFEKPFQFCRNLSPLQRANKFDLV
jgi:hypothetical protein